MSNYKTKVKSNKTVVQRSNVGEDITFGINFNAKMAGVLSSRIYSDKILAIVRELSTNAHEAHVMNGNEEQQFDVHLPTYENRQFVIRDYGIGLSPDQVKNIFTQYGMSDKEDNMKVDGFLGLGSKSPFCYHTQSFTVESWCDNIHYIYHLYISDDGMPHMTLMSQTESDEPNGVRISLDVERNDIYNFESAAHKVYRYFDVKPNINSISLESVEYIDDFGSDKWKIRKNGTSMRAVMGNLSYPIEIDKLTNLSDKLKNLDKIGIDVFVERGSVDIMPSREGLSYDKGTQYYLCMRLEEIHKELTEAAESKIGAAKNLYNARKIAFNMQKNHTLMVSLRDLNYKGSPLVKNANPGYSYYDTTLSSPIKLRNMVTHNGRWTNSVNWNSLFILNDTSTAPVARARVIASKDREHREVFLINPDEKQTVKNLCGCDDDDFVLTSSIPWDGSQYVETRVKTEPVMQFKTGAINATSSWDNQEWPTNLDNVLYVEFKTFKGVHDGHKYDYSYISILMHAIQEFTGKTYTLYGVKTKNLDEVPNGVENLFDFALELLESTYDSFYPYYRAIMEEANNNSRNEPDFEVELEFLANSSDLIKRYLTRKKKVFTLKNKLDKHLKLVRRLEHALTNESYDAHVMDLPKPDIVAPKDMLQEYLDEIVKRYPLLIDDYTVDRMNYYSNYVTIVEKEYV